MEKEKNVKDMSLVELRKEMLELMNPKGENWKRRKALNVELKLRLKELGWTR